MSETQSSKSDIYKKEQQILSCSLQKFSHEGWRWIRPKASATGSLNILIGLTLKEYTVSLSLNQCERLDCGLLCFGLVAWKVCFDFSVVEIYIFEEMVPK